MSRGRVSGRRGRRRTVEDDRVADGGVDGARLEHVRAVRRRPVLADLDVHRLSGRGRRRGRALRGHNGRSELQISAEAVVRERIIAVKRAGRTAATRIEASMAGCVAGEGEGDRKRAEGVYKRGEGRGHGQHDAGQPRETLSAI